MQPLPLLSAALQRSSEAFQQLRTRRYRSYHLVSKDESNTDVTKAGIARAKAFTQRWVRLPTFANFRLWYTLLVLLLASIIVQAVYQSRAKYRSQSLRQQDHFLKLLLPSSDPDSELCKTVLTAGVLGYPAPTIVNYDMAYGKPAKRSERDFQRIKAIDDYLSSHTTARNEDVVILLDTPWAWLQLRPEVLLNRYYRIVNEATESLQKKMGEKTLLKSGISQSIVFAAQRSCHNGTKDGITCLAVPQSPLSGIAGLADLRYLSVATTVGPVGKLRPLFKYIRSRAGKAMDDVDMQVLMEDAFGKQEYQREGIRLQARSLLAKIWESISGRNQMIAHESQGRSGSPEPSYEFGITLDYAHELGLAVTDGHGEDIEWTEDSISSSLSTDIQNSMGPFWTPSGENTPSQQGWEDVKLLVDKATGSVPAIITLGWNKGTSFQSREWGNFWMSANARTLLEQNLQVPRLPMTSVIDPLSELERVFWDSEVRFDRAGMKTIGGTWGKWDDLCEREGTYRPYGNA